MTSNQWACTDTKFSEIRFTWTIRNFSLHEEPTGEKIISPLFYSGGKYEDQWCLIIYPRGHSKSTKDDIALFLKLVKSQKTEIKLFFTLSILNPEGNENVNRKRADGTYDEGHSLGWHDFIKRREVQQFMENDTLRLHCKMILKLQKINVSSSEAIEVPEDLALSQNRLSDELWQCYKNSSYSDVTIIVRDKKILTHKLILTRSSVFAEMLSKSSAEMRKSFIRIEDMEPEVVEKMLQFMYTDDVQNIEGIVDKLLEAADKYSVKGLKTFCEKSLFRQLTKDNAAHIFIIADRYNAKILRNHVIKFITKNLSKIIETVGYKELEKEHSELLQYLIRQIAFSRKRKLDDVQ